MEILSTDKWINGNPCREMLVFIYRVNMHMHLDVIAGSKALIITKAGMYTSKNLWFFEDLLNRKGIDSKLISSIFYYLGKQKLED